MKPEFEHIYHKYKYRIFCYARKYLPAHEAEDIAAQAFIKLWEKWENMRPEDRSIEAFLFITTKNAAIQYLGSSYKRKEFCNDTYSDTLIDEGSIINDDLVEIKAEVMKRLLAEIIPKLNKNPRNVIQMTLKGYSAIQISQLLGLSYQTIKNQRVQAYKIIRNYITRELKKAAL